MVLQPRSEDPHTLGTWSPDSKHVDLYTTALADTVRAYYPAPNEARTEFALGLFMYTAAHELTHAQHYLKVANPQGALPGRRHPPMDVLLSVSENTRKKFVEKSIPRFLPIGPKQPPEVAKTALGARMTLRQNYLAGIPCHYEKSCPGQPAYFYENLAMGEVIAHWGAMTELVHYMEKGPLPPEAGNVVHHMLDSVQELETLLNSLSPTEQAVAKKVLQTIEGGYGEQPVDKPVLMDGARLQALRHRLAQPTSAHAHETHIPISIDL